MPKGYRAYLPDQDFLLPPSLSQWLPEGHLAYFVSDVVGQLDLAPMHAEYGDERRGQPPYDPRMMTLGCHPTPAIEGQLKTGHRE